MHKASTYVKKKGKKKKKVHGTKPTLYCKRLRLEQLSAEVEYHPY